LSNTRTSQFTAEVAALMIVLRCKAEGPCRPAALLKTRLSVEALGVAAAPVGSVERFDALPTACLATVELVD
jgi:hypothetical protein